MCVLSASGNFWLIPHRPQYDKTVDAADTSERLEQLRQTGKV
jgi:hypothetical protein